MSEQTTLWDSRFYHHRHDPPTSRDAAQSVLPKIPAQCARVVDAFKRYGRPATAKEIAGDDREFYYVINRRLVDCRRRGLLHKVGEKDGSTLYAAS